MGEALKQTYYSIKDYIEIEEKSLEKYEYHSGQIYMMAGGTPNHSLLQTNICASLRDSLRKKKQPCLTYGSDLKIATSDEDFSYADGVVICGKLEISPELSLAATNPLIIVEVLSTSTEKYDRGDKFQEYRNIPTFKEYILISQDKMYVEVFFKPDDIIFWQYRSYQNLDETIELKSVDCEISLADIYFGWVKP
jgi:Uma2 family endonuclease